VRGKSHYEINVFLQNTLAIIIGTLLFNTFFQSTWQKKTEVPFEVPVVPDNEIYWSLFLDE